MKNIFKVIILLPVICSLIIAIAFIIGGVQQAYLGIVGIINGFMHTDEYPGLKLVEALDLFIVSFLFIIFSLGFSKLFMPKSKFYDFFGSITPQWLENKNFSELKIILWETVITTLIVVFAGQVLMNHDNLSWQIILVPASILILSISIYFIKK